MLNSKELSYFGKFMGSIASFQGSMNSALVYEMGHSHSYAAIKGYGKMEYYIRENYAIKFQNRFHRFWNIPEKSLISKPIK